MQPIVYSQEFLGGLVDLSPYSTLQNNRTNTAKLLERINTNLNNKYGAQEGFCIPIAGSYGRLEASKLSDVDLFIIHDDSISKRKAESLRKDALSETRNLGINAPNPRGIFKEPSHLGRLVSNIGAMEDSTPQLSQRMLLLMESQPLYNENLFQSAVKKLLGKYCEHVTYAPRKEFVLLLNEVIRYFRTICVNYQFSFWRENENWPIRNIKLRHSRIVMYGSLLMLIMNASKYGTTKYDYLEQHIFLTPLEKICHVYLDNGDNPAKFLSLYDNFLSKMGDATVRQSLVGLGYEERYNNSHYKRLKRNSDELCSELARFILSRRSVWTNAIFEYLII